VRESTTTINSPSTMNEVLRVPPTWLSKSLQGLAFWVGHRCSIYSDWELSEGALVGELCNLIHAHLNDDSSLRCEQVFNKFVQSGVSRAGIGERARIDLSIWKSSVNPEGKRKQIPAFAIEVKRASAPVRKIEEDLRRLAAIVEETDGVRALLCVISERKLPKRFVNPKTGYRKKGVTPIETTSSSYQVIGVVRASAHQKRIARNHYCCAIEVLPNKFYEEAKRDREAAEDEDQA
jgi:hypothetical protein